MTKTILSTNRVGIEFTTDDIGIGVCLARNFEEAYGGALLTINIICFAVYISFVPNNKN